MSGVLNTGAEEEKALLQSCQLQALKDMHSMDVERRSIIFSSRPTYNILECMPLKPVFQTFEGHLTGRRSAYLRSEYFLFNTAGMVLCIYHLRGLPLNMLSANERGDS